MQIQYKKGDATKPIGEGNKIICHIVNDIGAWGSGFVVAVSRKWKKAETEYRKWANGYVTYKPFELGQVQFVKVEPNIVIANMVGQHKIGSQNGVHPIRYPALNECLEKVSKVAKQWEATVHGPRFGSGLAGGKWLYIEELINKNLCDKGIEVYIYDL